MAERTLVRRWRRPWYSIPATGNVQIRCVPTSTKKSHIYLNAAKETKMGTIPQWYWKVSERRKGRALPP